jgi:hypothetical protein
MKQISRRYDTAINIINFAIENKCSIKAASEHYGFDGSFITNYLNRGDINANLTKGTITQNEYNHIFNLFSTYNSTKSKHNTIDITSTVNNLISKLDAHISLNEPSNDDTNLDLIYNDILTKTKKGLTNFEVKDLSILTGLYNTYKDKFGNINPKLNNNFKRAFKEESDQTLEEKYDKRSYNNVIRDEDGKIVKYTFKILVRDEPDFVGELTREQMETIYSNYPYITQKSCSQYFPYLTFPQFKKIVRCFNITKDMLFPQHILEEKTDEEAAKLALKHKELSAYKKFQELKPVFLEKELHDTKQELFKLKKQREGFDILLKDYISEYVEQLTPIIKNTNRISNSEFSDKALVIYLSDMHIGAENKEVQYSSEYNKDVYLDRLSNILVNVEEELDTHEFEKIYIVGLGDQIDGFNAETTRGGHALPQNLTNKEQFNIYLNSMIGFVDKLTDMFDGTIEFIHVLESNHGGDFEYGANKALEHILPLKFPTQAKARVLGKNIDHFEYGVHTLICTHGKDNKTMSRNLPMYLNPNTTTNINEYIDFNKIKSDSILFVKGDLHNHTSETSKRFKYINVPSIYGGSGYTDANFGRTRPATLLHILHKNKTKINEIYVDLV